MSASSELLAQSIGHLLPLLVSRFGGFLRKDGLDHGNDSRSLSAEAELAN
ncbi:hypothetical protein GGQ82_001861 [Sphingobium olei]